MRGWAVGCVLVIVVLLIIVDSRYDLFVSFRVIVKFGVIGVVCCRRGIRIIFEEGIVFEVWVGKAYIGRILTEIF